MKKRILSLLLCCIMALGLLPMTAFAAETVQSIAVTVKEPVAGEAPDYQPEYTADLTGSVETSAPSSWARISEENFGSPMALWIVMQEGDKFEAGYYYMLRVNLAPINGHSFDDNTAVTVNGSSDNVYFEIDPNTGTACITVIFMQSNSASVSSEAELRAAIDAGKTNIKLTGDFKTTDRVALNDKEITLDLNGYYIVPSNYNRYTDVFFLEDTSAAGKTSLTLIDSRPEAGHWTDTLPKGGLVRGKITVTVKDGGTNCQLIGNGGSVTGPVNLASAYASIRCTNDTPTAFYNDAHNYGNIYGGIFYGENTDIKGIQEPTVTFKYNDTLYAREVVESGKKAVAPIPPQESTADGYHIRWYQMSEDGTVAELPYDFSTPVTKDITLVAKWENTYMVTFDSNGGTEVDPVMLEVGAPVTAPTNPTRRGHTFNGWQPDTVPMRDVTVKAQWTVDTYLVTLNTNGGFIQVGDVAEYTYGVGAKLPVWVARSGYYFAGWYDNEACTGNPVTEIGTDEVGPKEYWAKWIYFVTANEIYSVPETPETPAISDNPANGWVEENGVWYYYSDDTAATGWQKIDGVWYYLDPRNGAMAEDGMQEINGEIYYFYDWGGMASNFWYQDDEGDWYYFGGDGAMVENKWVLCNDAWYYLGSDGAMLADQWLYWNGAWYYLGSDGAMLTNAVTPDGYYVNNIGVWVK